MKKEANNIDSTDETAQETPLKPPIMSAKIKRVMKLMDSGVDVREAIELGTGNANPHVNTLTDVRQKHEKWSLMRPEMQKLAHKAVKDTLKMKEQVLSDGTVSAPSHTNRLAASQMILDRTEPIIKQVQVQSISFNVAFNIDDLK